MIRQKVKKTIKKARKCCEYAQTTSIALIMALFIVAKSQRNLTPRQKSKKKTVMSSNKTPLNEEPFGIRSMERLDVGDLVQWSELGPDGYNQEKKIGVISELYLEKRGSRNIALAKINEIVKSKNNLSLLGREKEVLVVSLHILSKVSEKNELLSV